MKLRILVCDGIAPAGLALLRREADVLEAKRLRDLGSVDAIIVRSQTKVTHAVVAEAAPRLKVIGRAGVGVDNIDLDAAQDHQVMVVNAPMASATSVAELTLGLLLGMMRLIPQANASMERGEWHKKKLRGAELHGKTLGVIGLGRIGSRVAQLGQAFGMRILGHDPYVSRDVIQAKAAEPVALDALLKQADVISIHVPLNQETRELIGVETLSKVKEGVRILSTARGGIIDEEALLAALETGRVAGAALDVFAEEPPGLSPLIQHPKVISTPHIGAQTREAQTRVSIDVAVETLAALHGEPLRWRVV
jgi:D-3-phosphoglycerate dehydrogenase